MNDGWGALLTVVDPTFSGSFLQGAIKFGGYEFFKGQSFHAIDYDSARNNRIAVYCESSATAEFFATDPVSGFIKIANQEGIAAVYSDFGPILPKHKANVNSIYVATSGGTCRNWTSSKSYVAPEHTLLQPLTPILPSHEPTTAAPPILHVLYTQYDQAPLPTPAPGFANADE